ncbi:MAG: hypothetical protein GY851_22140 [bacterium]|nr:hypothetical protein [bacterium]
MRSRRGLKPVRWLVPTRRQPLCKPTVVAAGNVSVRHVTSILDTEWSDENLLLLRTALSHCRCCGKHAWDPVTADGGKVLLAQRFACPCLCRLFRREVSRILGRRMLGYQYNRPSVVVALAPSDAATIVKAWLLDMLLTGEDPAW